MPIGAAAPSDTLHTWATDALTRVEPSAGQKLTGYTSGHRPTFSVINWLLGLLLDWVIWLRAAALELDTDKIDRDGSVTMSGVLTPAAGTVDIALTGNPFRTAYLKNVVIKELLIMDAAARVSADMLPASAGIALGSNALPFKVTAGAMVYAQSSADINDPATSFDATNKSFIEVFTSSTPTIDTITGGVNGQQLTLLALDTGITLTSGGNLSLSGGSDWVATSNDTISFIYSATQAGWIETSRTATP